MKMVRNLSAVERKYIYVSERIDDQRRWYNEKTETNLKAANKFFYGTVASETLAVISAFIIILFPQSLINITGFLTTLAAAFLAWTQTRRNEQLSQSYGLAAQELHLIHEQASEIQDDGELSQYVINSENAISREHTMWLARRSQ